MPAVETARYKAPVPESDVWSADDLPEALRRAIEVCIDRKARRPVVLRLTEKAGYTDWALIVSGRSDRHVRGITEGLRDELAKSEPKLKPIGTDGLEDHNWDLLDYDDFLVHVFYHPVRTFYDLESMWSDVPRVELNLPAEVMDISDMTGLAPPEPMPEFRGTTEFGGFDDEFGDDDDLEDELRAKETTPGAHADDEPFPADDDDDDEPLFEP